MALDILGYSGIFWDILGSRGGEAGRLGALALSERCEFTPPGQAKQKSGGMSDEPSETKGCLNPDCKRECPLRGNWLVHGQGLQGHAQARHGERTRRSNVGDGQAAR